MPFAKRRIDLQFQLGEGSYGELGFNTIDVTGLRCHAQITKAINASMAQLDLVVYGMNLEIINALTRTQVLFTKERINRVVVLAGDAKKGMSTCFAGNMSEAWGDFNSQPETSFIVKAFTAMPDQMRPINPTSYRGAADVDVIMSTLARQMGKRYENSGVTGVLRNQYLAGTAWDQAQTVRRALRFDMSIDDEALAIWPRNGARGGQAVLINSETGMVGYPTFSQGGIMVTTLFDPRIQAGVGFQVESTLTPAEGLWKPYHISHDLESETPNGKWFTHIEAIYLDREGSTLDD